MTDEEKEQGENDRATAREVAHVFADGAEWLTLSDAVRMMRRAREDERHKIPGAAVKPTTDDVTFRISGGMYLFDPKTGAPEPASWATDINAAIAQPKPGEPVEFAEIVPLGTQAEWDAMVRAAKRSESVPASPPRGWIPPWRTSGDGGAIPPPPGVEGGPVPMSTIKPTAETTLRMIHRSREGIGGGHADAFMAGADALALLRELEWTSQTGMKHDENEGWCIQCGWKRAEGHAPDCRLASLIGVKS